MHAAAHSLDDELVARGSDNPWLHGGQGSLSVPYARNVHRQTFPALLGKKGIHWDHSFCFINFRMSREMSRDLTWDHRRSKRVPLTRGR